MISRSWLPPDCLVAPAVRAPIEEAVAAWSRNWFGGRADLRLTAFEPRPPLWAAELGNAAWKRPGASVSLAIPASALLRLRAKALDIRIAARAETERDAALLRGFDERMVADLAARVESSLCIRDRSGGPSLPPDPWTAGEPALCALVAEPNGAEAVRLAIPVEDAVAFRKLLLGPPRRRAPPGRREAAIGMAKARIEARLGTARLTLGELRELAAGDVLVLDRDLEAPAELLAADGSRVALGRLDSAERLTLILQA